MTQTEAHAAHPSAFRADPDRAPGSDTGDRRPAPPAHPLPAPAPTPVPRTGRPTRPAPSPISVRVDADATRRAEAQVEIVVPVYNEAGGLERSVRRLHDHLQAHFPLPWLITIADNASTDRTWSIACGLAAQLDGVQAVHLDQKGRGRALRATWLSSPAPVVAYMDVDLSTDLDALLPLVAPLVTGHSEVAIGTRLARGARVVRGPRRELISRAYNLLLTHVMHAGFSDAQCGFKAIRTDVAHALVPLVEDDAWFFDTELLILAEHNGLRIHEVPVDWVDDPDSRVDVVGTATDDLRGMWRMTRAEAHGHGAAPSLIRRRDPAEHADAASRLVRMAPIGVIGTLVYGAIALSLLGSTGVLVANAIALATVAWLSAPAYRRLDFAVHGRTGRGRHAGADLVLHALPLTFTMAAAGALARAGVTSPPALVAALAAANGAAIAIRAALWIRWSRPASPAPAAPGSPPAPTTRADRAPRLAPPHARRIVPQLLARAERLPAIGHRVPQLLRYGAVSLIATTTSLTVLGVLVTTNALSAVAANIVATAVGTVPSFELNRRWVWAKRGRRSIWTEVGPFCILSFAGLALSTVAVGVVAAWADATGLTGWTRTALVELANVSAFGLLWIAQFVILDRVLFGRSRRGAALPPAASRTVPA